MDKSLFKIVFNDGKNTEMCITHKSGLYEIIDNFIDSDNFAIAIVKTSKDSINENTQKYFKSQYNYFRKKYRQSEINENQYKEIITNLKKFKENTDSDITFEEKFEEYKKTLTIIPPYNVSD